MDTTRNEWKAQVEAAIARAEQREPRPIEEAFGRGNKFSQLIQALAGGGTAVKLEVVSK